MTIKKLREIREENELKQKDIANILGISLGTYAMNEIGSDNITLTNLVKFYDYFNVSIDYTLGYSQNKNYPNLKKGINKEKMQVRLKEFRTDNNLSQTKIGDILGIDHSVWCRYEKGKTVILTTFVNTLCAKYNISADYILGKIDKPKYLKTEEKDK